MDIKLSQTKFGLAPPPPDHMYASVTGVSADDCATIKRLKLSCEYDGNIFSFPITVRTPFDGHKSDTVIRVTEGKDGSALLHSESEERQTVYLLCEDASPKRGECSLDSVFGGRGTVRRDIRIAYCIARIAEYISLVYSGEKISIFCDTGLVDEEILAILKSEIEEKNFQNLRA